MSKKLLIHICCAPCFIGLQKPLQANGWDIHGFWYNHNIHPFLEYNKRLIALQNLATEEDIPLIVKAEYDLEKFLRNSAFRESTRCFSCYYERLKYCVIVAKKGNFDAFSTTLLYSKYQNHQMIKEICQALSQEYKIDFYYEDFRQYWQEGIELSKARGLYRQQYCGCIYSEHQRYKNVGDIGKLCFPER
jgi:predicted adenine nucleotide alpha hydrolase (AANH) superfamily ATPase